MEVRLGDTEAWDDATKCEEHRTIGGKHQRHRLHIDAEGSEAAIFSCDGIGATQGPRGVINRGSKRYLFVGLSDETYNITGGANLKLCEVRWTSDAV